MNSWEERTGRHAHFAEVNHASTPVGPLQKTREHQDLY